MLALISVEWNALFGRQGQGTCLPQYLRDWVVVGDLQPPLIFLRWSQLLGAGVCLVKVMSIPAIRS